MKSLDALPLTSEELATYQARTGRQAPPADPVREAYACVGRRGGKSQMAALVAVDRAVRPRTWKLAPGEQATIAVIAADRRQAGVVMNYVKGLLTASPVTRRLVKGRPTINNVTLTNGSRIEIHTSSFRSTRGYTLACAICDEVAFWRSEDGSANPDSEVIAALRPGLLTSKGLLLVISTPYSRRGVLWDAFKSHMCVDGDPVLFWSGSSLSMHPDLDERIIAKAYEDDAQAASAEYGGEFRSDIDAFISEELLQQAVVPGRLELPRSSGHVAFVDPSGGSQDSFTLAIAHPDKETVVLDLVAERVPPFSPEDVVREFSAVCQAYGVTRVTGDHYAGEFPRELFRKHGITYAVSEQTKSEIGTPARLIS